jgi:hypothetical protein
LIKGGVFFPFGMTLLPPLEKRGPRNLALVEEVFSPLAVMLLPSLEKRGRGDLALAGEVFAVMFLPPL